MNTFNDSYRSSSFRDNKYTLTFKVPLEIHNQVQEVASRLGKNITTTSRDLLERGLSEYNRRDASLEDIPRFQLYKELGIIRKLQEDIQALAVIKPEVGDEAFQRHCHALGIDPAEIEDVAPITGKTSKKDRCRSFLRILFTDRPAGIPANRVLEIADREGFGENLTREVAAEMGICFQPTETENGRLYMWMPPEAL